MWRVDSFEKTLMLGKIEGRKRRGWQRMRWLDSITNSWTWIWVGSGNWWWTGRPEVLRFMGLRRVGHDWATELNWNESHQQCKRAQFKYSWVRMFLWRRDRLLTPVFSIFPGGSDGKESTCHKETWVWFLGWEDHLEEGIPTHSSILAWRIPMDRGAWWATVHGLAKS